MLKAALSHDVDRVRKTYQYITHTAKSFVRGRFNDVFFHLKSISDRNIYWNIEDVAGIETDLNVKSTFFFLQETIPFQPLNIKNWRLSLGRYDIREKKVSNAIKLLHKNGWEIGVHGSYNSYCSLDLLKNEKHLLESITGAEVTGIRQHYLNVNSQTWELQKKAGYKYDSSFGFTRDLGYRDNKYNHFFPFNDYFAVIPMVIMDAAFSRHPHRWERFREIINESRKHDGLIVLNWHTNNYNEREYPKFKSNYIECIKILKNEGAEFMTLRDYYNQNCSQK